MQMTGAAALRSRCVRVLTVAAVCCAIVTGGLMPGPVAAAPGDAVTLCTNSDPRLAEASGLVTTPDGYAVVNDGGDQVIVYLLDRDCAITRTLTSPENPFDPEDLARTDDGTLWIADTGDNDFERTSVVIWEISPGTGAATLHRLAYPDGAHDAEALLMPADKTPVIVTKEPSGIAKVYVAAQPLAAPTTATLPLRAAGTVTITAAGTIGGPADAGPVAGLLVTGGALASDGKHAVLRTYTDAYEWPLDDATTATDIAQQLTSGEPVRTALPGEPQGESIGYTSDNAEWVTLSEGAGQPLQQWKPTRAAPESGPESDDGDSGGGIGVPDLNRANLMGSIYVAAVLGLLLLIAGIVGIVRWRRRQPTAGDADAGDTGEDDRSAQAPLLYPPAPAPAQLTAGQSPQKPPGGTSRGTTYGSGSVRGTVYGGAPGAVVPPAGAPPPSGGKRGTVYGGRSGPPRPKD